MQHFAQLNDRSLIHITGEDVHAFLNGLVTCDMGKKMPQFGALLSPQGKILFDFIIHASDTGYYIDCAKNITGDFVKRLGFYKLRAKVNIADVKGEMGVMVSWENAGNDPRYAALGTRMIAPTGPTHLSEADYHAHRIALGVPEGGKDFNFGEAFPHEVLMDQLNGVDFLKGCYVGQEVVSRMQHRGTARTRMMQIVLERELTTKLPAPIMANGKNLGELRTVSGMCGLATVRIDRASEAIKAGLSIDVEGNFIQIKKPDFAQFKFPLIDQLAKTET